MDDVLNVTSALAIPLDEVLIRVSRSSGPGGQHANKTETRVEAVFDVAASSSLSTAQKSRLTTRAGPVVTAVAQDTRSRLRNRELALDRLAARLRAALATPRARRATKPSRGAVERRLAAKRRDAEVKRARRRPSGGW